tara:strand:- start:45 stop:695 length:651 start_codon:yes stop_codon:yes gene_type:complete
MAINSTEVSYGFGQMGSAIMDLDKPVYPPKGKVIIAITMLTDDVVFDTLTPEEGRGESFLSTSTSENDNNYHGIHESSAIAAATYAPGSNITITASTLVKPGQYVLLVNAGDSLNAGITVDAETPTPIYNGVGRQGCFVDTVNAAGTIITLGSANTTAANCQITPSGTQNLIFLDESAGAGGTNVASIKFPKGLTIAGRWTKVVPSSSTIVCYFGE